MGATKLELTLKQFKAILYQVTWTNGSVVRVGSENRLSQEDLDCINRKLADQPDWNLYQVDAKPEYWVGIDPAHGSGSSAVTFAVLLDRDKPNANGDVFPIGAIRNWDPKPYPPKAPVTVERTIKALQKKPQLLHDLQIAMRTGHVHVIGPWEKDTSGIHQYVRRDSLSGLYVCGFESTSRGWHYEWWAEWPDTKRQGVMFKKGDRGPEATHDEIAALVDKGITACAEDLCATILPPIGPEGAPWDNTQG